MANEIYNHSHWGFPRYTDWGGEYYADTGNLITDGDFTTQSAVNIVTRQQAPGEGFRADLTRGDDYLRITYNDVSAYTRAIRYASILEVDHTFKIFFFARTNAVSSNVKWLYIGDSVLLSDDEISLNPFMTSDWQLYWFTPTNTGTSQHCRFYPNANVKPGEHIDITGLFIIDTT